MNAHLLHAKAEFWRTYAVVRQSLEKRGRCELMNVQQEAGHIINEMQLPFSERAAAQMVHTACTELLS